MFLSFLLSLCDQDFHYFLFLQLHVAIIIIITCSVARCDESDNGFKITPCYLRLVRSMSVRTCAAPEMLKTCLGVSMKIPDSDTGK